MKALRWFIVPLIFFAVAGAVWLVWGWRDVNDRVPPQRDQAYYDPASRLWVTFGPGGVGPQPDAPRPEADPAIAPLVDRHAWSVYPTRDAYQAHAAGDSEAARVEVWHVTGARSAESPDALAGEVDRLIRELYAEVEELTNPANNDAGLRGVRINAKQKATDSAGRARQLRWAVLQLDDEAWLAWSNLPMSSPYREAADQIVRSMRFRRGPE